MHNIRSCAASFVLVVLPVVFGVACSKHTEEKIGASAAEHDPSSHAHGGEQNTAHDPAAHDHTPANGVAPTTLNAPVNTKCPITGDPVDPKLTLDYKGKSVGLCCKDCIAEWNKLSDAEKDAKLKP